MPPNRSPLNTKDAAVAAGSEMVPMHQLASAMQDQLECGFTCNNNNGLGGFTSFDNCVQCCDCIKFKNEKGQIIGADKKKKWNNCLAKKCTFDGTSYPKAVR